MRIKFMGTAAAEGFPAIFCHCDACKKAKQLGGKNIRRTSVTLIDDNILIDFGPDLLTHSHVHSLSLIDLDAIIITHSHRDHLFEQSFNYALAGFGVSKRTELMSVYGNEKVIAKAKAIIKKKNDFFEFIMAKKFEPFKVKDYTIYPMLATHMSPSEDEEPLIFMIEKDDKLFLNGNDTAYFSDETWEYLSDFKLDAVSLDTTAGNLYDKILIDRHHMNIYTVNIVKQEMLKKSIANDKTKFIMNHFTHHIQLLHEDLAEIADKIGFSVAYDGYTIEI